uniref:ATP-dependent DNA ligase family profile domain-containing protein n=1 Tax=Kalanchoe fedtschenkoi TaxID=63787 RepID=A0A7N0SW83_KALFE
MSRRPSAFDALMSGARAAAAKRKSNPEASPSKKRKSAESKPPLVTNGEKAAVDSVKPELEMEISSTGNGTADAASSDAKQCDPVECVKSDAAEEPGAKKPRAMTAEERRAELKSKIGSLKKKPADFDPRSVACWEDGERVPFLFLFLCLAFDMISNESGRIVITDIVCNMLRTIIKTTPDDLVAAVYLSANRVAPAHEGVEMGIGDASIIKALAEACGGKEAHIKNQYKEKGDLGLVAKESRSSQSMMRKPAALTVAKVFDTFRIIAKESGKDSQEKKKKHIKSLLVAATDCEPQYLIRLLQAKLRIGYAEQTLLAALGQAALYTENHSKPPPHVSSPLEEVITGQIIFMIHLKKNKGYFEFATSITSNDLEEIQNFLEASVDGSCEGLIIKTLDTDATYEPSKRSNNWLKLKKDYMDRWDTIGAFHGRGKRTCVYGAFLACYDPDNEEFQSICKIGTGFSEVVLEERSASLRSKVITKPKSYYRCGETINPDIWFEPTEINDFSCFSVKAADLTISPAHQAAVGIVDPAKGISLRFPCLLCIRDDKNPEQATSSAQVGQCPNKMPSGMIKADDRKLCPPSRCRMKLSMESCAV